MISAARSSSEGLGASPPPFEEFSLELRSGIRLEDAARELFNWQSPRAAGRLLGANPSGTYPFVDGLRCDAVMCGNLGRG
jgi:hypothetical protein